VRNGIRIGKLLGITIVIDWSWLFIFLLVTWNLATFLRAAQPDWSPVAVWGLAAAAALLFFASVLAHEMGHSLVARSRGMPVHNITLFMFGGVSNLQREPESARDEFATAIVGPLTSIAIGAVLALIAGASVGRLGQVTSDPLEVVRSLGPLTFLVFWLGSVNVLLGVFNLIPGFPLDGGRVLRSIFWATSGSLVSATKWATAVGRLVAWAFILAGIAMAFGVRLPIFGTGVVAGLWLAFIGWFLNSAASQSYQQVLIRDVLDGVPVSQMMRPDPPTVTEEVTVSELAYDHIMRADDRAFPVMHGDTMIGIVSVEDLRKVPRDRWEMTPVRQIMTGADHLVTVNPDDEATEALNRLAQHDVRQLPVVKDGRLVGLLRRSDLLRWLQLHSGAIAG